MNQQNFRDSLGNSFILLLCSNIALWLMLAPMHTQTIDDLTRGTWKEITFQNTQDFSYDFWNLDHARAGADPVINIKFNRSQSNYRLRINCTQLAPQLCLKLQQQKFNIVDANFYVHYSQNYLYEIHHEYVLKSFRYQAPQGQLFTQPYHTVSPNHPNLIFKQKRQFFILALGFSVLFLWIAYDIRQAKYFHISLASFKALQKLLYIAVATSALALWLTLINSVFFT